MIFAGDKRLKTRLTSGLNFLSSFLRDVFFIVFLICFKSLGDNFLIVLIRDKGYLFKNSLCLEFNLLLNVSISCSKFSVNFSLAHFSSFALYELRRLKLLLCAVGKILGISRILVKSSNGIFAMACFSEFDSFLSSSNSSSDINSLFANFFKAYNIWYGNFLMIDINSGEKFFKKFFSISVNLHIFNLWISKIIEKFSLANFFFMELLILQINFFSSFDNFLGFLKELNDLDDLDNCLIILFLFDFLLVSLSKIFFDLLDLLNFLDEFEYPSTFTKFDSTLLKLSTLVLGP